MDNCLLSVITDDLDKSKFYTELYLLTAPLQKTALKRQTANSKNGSYGKLNYACRTWEYLTMLTKMALKSSMNFFPPVHAFSFREDFNYVEHARQSTESNLLCIV